jgi:hypothetical protein
MRTTRRNLLVTTALLPVAIAVGCADIPITPAEILTDVSAVISGLSGALSTVEAAAPAAIPAATAQTIQTDLTTAGSVAQNLVAGLPATSGASIVQEVEGYLNDILKVAAAPPLNALIPAPFSTALAAAAVVMPTLEAFVGQYIATVSASVETMQARAKLVAAASQPIAGVDQAVAVLQSLAKAKQ